MRQGLCPQWAAGMTGGGRLAAMALFACLFMPLLIVVGVLSVDGNNDGTDDYAAAASSMLTGGSLRPDAPIKAAFVPWVNRAGSLCREVTPALIAAQIDTESGWNPNARAANPP